jgi:hypothetical protein
VDEIGHPHAWVLLLLLLLLPLLLVRRCGGLGVRGKGR